jgi:hypothetical protein
VPLHRQLRQPLPGDNGKAVTPGDNGKAVTPGDNGKAVTPGDNGKAVTPGTTAGHKDMTNKGHGLMKTWTNKDID